MNPHNEEQQPRQTSILSLIAVTLASAIVGSGALWFTWFRYDSFSNRPDIPWNHWVQLIFLALMGILCLSAALLFISGRPSAWSVFKAGLSIVPLLLFFNLVVLVFRVIQNILQGNGMSFLSRLYANPLNKAMLGVVLVFILLSVLKEFKKP